jgi:hypothetical protein
MKEEEMPSDRAPDTLVSAWQQQPTSGFRMVPADFAKKIRKDVRYAPWGFWIFLVFFAVLIIRGGVKLFAATDPVLRTGYVLWIVTLAFFVGQTFVLHRRVRAVRSDILRTTSPSLAAARAYLLARRAFHSGRWLWSRVIVLFPVLPVAAYGQLRTDPEVMGDMLYWMAVWIALLAFAVFVVQRGAARAYDRLLRELDDIERQSPLERFMASHEQWKDRQGD